MKKILIPLLMLFSCQSAFAISGKDAEHYMSREPMRKEYAKSVAQATERNLAKVRNQTSSGVSKSVISQINSSATVSDGSKVSGGATVTKPVDPKAVSKTIVQRLEKAKALGKASLPSFLGSAALTALVHGVGWVIDEGGKVKRVPELIDPDDPRSQYFLVVSSASFKPSLVGKKITTSDYGFCSGLSNNGANVNLASKFDTSALVQDGGNRKYGCLATMYSGSKSYVVSFETIPNPNYDPNTETPMVEVPSDQLEQTINNYITNNDNSVTNNIINNAYSHDSSNGASPSDETNSLVSESHRDLSNAISQASTAPYNANNPKQGYYMITDGNKTIEGYVDTPSTSGSTDSQSESTTITNPDGSTTTTGTSESEFQLPAFCDWASIMCDWYQDFKDFVKEDDQEDEQPIEPDTSILDREFDTNFNMSGQCPPDPVIPMPMGLSLELPFSKICDFFSYLKFGVITAASLLSGWILYGAVNKGAE